MTNAVVPGRWSGSALVAAGRATVRGYKPHRLGIWAAALTYYGVLALFPGLLALVGILGLLSDSLTRTLLDNVAPVTPGAVRDILTTAINNVHSGGGASLVAIVGLLIAVWSASGYVNVFMEAANVLHDVTEERTVWQRLPVRVGVTVATGVLLVVSVLIVVLSGRLAEEIGRLLHLSTAAVTTWQILKWPLLVVLVSVMLTVLYRATPDTRSRGRWTITPGAVLAVLGWALASAAFAVYAGNFASYNRTYGSLGGVIAFLVWLWLTNLAVLLGAEFDARQSAPVPATAAVASREDDED